MPNLVSAIKRYKKPLELFFVLFCVYLTSFYEYLLFHALSEMIGVVILVMVFILTWHARKMLDNSYYLIIGLSFLFIGFMAFIHTLAYKGMGVFVSEPANTATQLWIASRYYLGFVFLVAPLFIGRKVRIGWLLSVNIFIFFSLIFTIFFWRIFPLAYIDGQGLTDFKVVSEYLIILLFFASMYVLYQRKSHFDADVYRYLQISLLAAALSDFFFTLYVGVYSSLNMIGHLLSVLSYYIIYLVIVKKALVDPHTILYKKLKDRESALRDSEHKYRSLVDLSPDGIILHESGKINYINLSAKKMIGHESSVDYLGRAVIDFVHPDYIEKIKGRIASIYGNEQEVLNPIEVRIIRKDKTDFMAEIQSSRISIDGKTNIQTIVRDVSERRELDKAKTEFIALTSHQLKTPLASMMLAIDLLYREAAGPVNEELKEYLDDLHDSIIRMDETIKTLLNVSKFEMGTLVFNKTPIDINSCVNILTDDVKNLVQKKNLRMNIDLEAGLPKISFDQSALKLIMENLISNAIRYSSEGGEINIKVRKRAEEILISVADNGCGIPEKDKKDIFKKSFRAENARKLSNAGSGLGLYMIKSIAEKVGAKIWFDSKEGVGTTFFVAIG